MKYRLLDTNWNCGVQQEMLKFPFVDWYWLEHYYRTRYTAFIAERQSTRQRVERVLSYDAGKYDAAILHLDYTCLDPVAWQYGRGSIYRNLDQLIRDIPKIVILHGLPPLRYKPPLFSQLPAILGSNYTVVSSRNAASRWGVGVPIDHGLEVAEWLDLPKQPRIITAATSHGRADGDGQQLLKLIRQELTLRDIIQFPMGPDYFHSDWNYYREFLGRSLLYCCPSSDLSMPHSRTEAMLSGCCVLTAPVHDASSFIEDGVNGFLIGRKAKDIIDLIEHLIANPSLAIEVGQRGKVTATQRFNHEQFAASWQDLLNQIIR